MSVRNPRWKTQTVTAGIQALEEQLAVSGDLHTAACTSDDFENERERVSTLSTIDRERREIANALRILRTHAVMSATLMV